METNFKTALTHVLLHEGGWADHPNDPGGPTMKGVTLITFRRHFGQEKTKEELRNISDSQLQAIYEAGYWQKCRCSDLPWGIDYAVFDAAVNSGPGRGAKWLQTSVGAKIDGGIGSETLACVKNHDPITVIDGMCDIRLGFLQNLSTWSVFGKGWGRRVEGVRSIARAMSEGYSAGIKTPVPSTDYVTVQKGSEGIWVKKVQKTLGVKEDGDFGKITETALKAWQTEHGLEPDGIAGRNTYRAMGLIE